MSDKNSEDPKELDLVGNTPEEQEDVESFMKGQKNLDINEENDMPSLKQEEEVIKKTYGGLLPKKPPLISKDHEHAFFDSADWALGKHGSQKGKGPLEALIPKLQPTPHHQVRLRRSAYGPADEGDKNDASASEDENCKVEGNTNNNSHSGDQDVLN